MQETPNDNTLDHYYRAHYRSLFRFALSVLKDRGQAEEAVQDTFTIAYRSSEKCLGSENPVGWLFLTLRHVMLHMLRERETMNRFFVALEDARGLSTELPEMDELEDSEDLRLLRHIYVDGYAITETALEMGVTPDALNSRIYRAKKRLQRDPRLRALWEAQT